MKKLLLATVSSLALAGMAYGADMQVAYKAAPPPPPAPTWTGFYVGIDGGVTRHDAWFNDLTGFVRFGSFASYNTAKTGGVLGGFAGYNWQDRSFVFGVEADINWIDAKAQETWGGLSVSSTTWQQSQDVPVYGINWWFTDVLPKGTPMLVPSPCTPSGETSEVFVRNALNQLGKGSPPAEDK